MSPTTRASMVRRGALYLVILGVAGVGIGLWLIGAGLAAVWSGHWFTASGEGIGSVVSGALIGGAGAFVFTRGRAVSRQSDARPGNE